MTKVKICGIRSFENALMVAEAGADLLGLNFYPKSPRYIECDAARDLVARLRSQLGEYCPLLVGVFVNASPAEIRRIVDTVGLDVAQLSGDESESTLDELHGIAFKAIRPKDACMAMADATRYSNSSFVDDAAPSLLLDAFNPKLYGGTGETTSVGVALAVKAQAPRLMLAGGLNPTNVAQRVRAIRPWGVDVASGVEDGTPGLKDEGKVREFIAAARSASA